MAFDAYIKIEGVPGEALDDRYKDCIEITGYVFGMNQSTSATASSSGGASSGRTSLSDFTFTKTLDKSSCKLIETLCAGKHLKEVVLTLHRAGGEKIKYFEVLLEELIISNYTQSADDGVPTETISLNYGKIKTTYTLQKRSDGSSGGNISGGWNRINNQVYA
ncbi:type VI secretion system tube protein Hcp [Pseudomonas alliivorans]|nr:type VI secretion system tube protein Hcp [Pseudomonas alliivorans]MEE4963294.1 type VI secretion system tube protein Hcp [Pseudomonas alliivorans]MEE4973085.1 type VI secretion system tube protein Hcp [Pseudomonas alliivorans]MEE4978585.1 type VI secretion system tube protein Hcp [Pseudomonas alliivorans]MEE4983794.1 type VI secretion system tube protein Hcp [Pseudomonas alliivorans]